VPEPEPEPVLRLVSSSASRDTSSPTKVSEAVEKEGADTGVVEGLAAQQQEQVSAR